MKLIMNSWKIAVMPLVLALTALGCSNGLDSESSNESAEDADHAAEALSSKDQHCVLVVEKVEPGEDASRVVESKCGTDAELRSMVAARARIMIWYSDKNHKGSWTEVFGKDGPCDRAGYTISTDVIWQNRISSYRVDSNCWNSRIWNLGNTAQDFAGHVPYVGNGYNDQVTKFKVWSQ